MEMRFHETSFYRFTIIFLLAAIVIQNININKAERERDEYKQAVSLLVNYPDGVVRAYEDLEYVNRELTSRLQQANETIETLRPFVFSLSDRLADSDAHVAACEVLRSDYNAAINVATHVGRGW